MLFPYLVDWRTRKPTIPNPFMADWRANVALEPSEWNRPPGPDITALPGGLASAPVHLVDRRMDEEHDVHFVAGMFGVVEDDDGVLSPEFGWAITYDR